MAASKPPAIVLSSWLSAISSRSRARSGGVEFGLLGVRAIVREGVLISVRRRTCSCSISLRKAESISGVGEESGELLVCKSIEGSFLDFQLLRQQRCHHFEIGVRLASARLRSPPRRAHRRPSVGWKRLSSRPCPSDAQA